MSEQATKKQRKRRHREKEHIDYTLLFIIVFMLGFGLVMLYSASSYNATLVRGDSTYYLKKQLFAAILGFVGMYFMIKIDYHFWLRLIVPIYFIAFFICIAVIFIGRSSHGSSRWIYIGPVSIQPSEIGKVALIITLAAVISRIPKQLRDTKQVIKTLIVVAGPMFLAVAINNLSTAIIILAIAFVMVFIATPKYKPFFLLGGLATIAIFIFIRFVGYRKGRIDAWLHPQEHDAYQTLQGLYAIGSGGLFGKGLGESIQKLGFVPEAQNDMIFSIICEELGLFGAICTIAMFVLLIWRFVLIAIHAKDMFGSYIMIGIIAHIAIQAILNIAVVTNTIPNTGVILPFISYGGTSIAILLTEMGLALNVSKGLQLE